MLCHRHGQNNITAWAFGGVIRVIDPACEAVHSGLALDTGMGVRHAGKAAISVGGRRHLFGAAVEQRRGRSLAERTERR